jgi:hypothetical protein
MGLKNNFSRKDAKPPGKRQFLFGLSAKPNRLRPVGRKKLCAFASLREKT